MKLTHLLSAVLIFFVQTVFAQKIKLIDSETGKPVENVYIFDTQNSVLTNKTGEADITGFLKKEILYFQHPAYENLKLSLGQIKKKSFIVNLKSTIFPIEEVVISVNKWEQNPDEIPLKVILLDNQKIKNSAAQTSADLLKATNRVYVQKSQLGGGSPMIRGFSANRVLLVLDGIRLNNAIYRSGNLQNVINIDPNSLESAEVILGPGSIIYGSDAIGGVMDFHTFRPKLSTSDKPNINFSLKSRYSSANQEIMNHGKYNFGTSKFSIAGSFSYSNFSDLKMGSHGPDDYLRPEYVTRVNGQDQITKNPNPEKQRECGYSQYNLVKKLRFKASTYLDFLYHFQYSETSNIPRYDRLIQQTNSELQYAEWYYGPQKLQLHGLQITNTKPELIYDSFKINAAYQNYRESRHSRELNSSSLKNRYENLNIFTVNADAEKEITSKTHFFYGGEWSFNKLDSKGFSKNINTGENATIASRYPDNSKYSSLAFYSNLKWKINERWALNSGIRYSHVCINSKLDNTFYNFPFDNLDLSTGAVNGGIGISHKSDKGWAIKLNATSGFRAPNIDDIGKVFDSEPGKVIVPNSDLRPEHVYNFECNVSKNIAQIFFFDLNVFYSFLNQAMIRKAFTFNGENSIIYDGVESEVQAIVNADHATIWGGNITTILKLSHKLSANTSLNITNGEYKDGSPVRHVPPLFGNASVKYATSKLKSEIEMEFNGEISYKNLADSEKDKVHLYAKDANGNPYSPNWAVVNFKNEIKLGKHINVNLSIENIFNRRYRPYSSGISAAGRNFILGLSYEM